MSKALFMLAIALMMPIGWAHDLYHWCRRNKAEVWYGVAILITMSPLILAVYFIIKEGSKLMNPGYEYGTVYHHNQMVVYSFLGSIAIYIIVSIFIMILWRRTVQIDDRGLELAEFWPTLITYFMFSTGGGISVIIVWYCVSKGWFV